MLDDVGVFGVDVYRVLDRLEFFSVHLRGLGDYCVHLVNAFERLLVVVAKLVKEPALADCLLVLV